MGCCNSRHAKVGANILWVSGKLADPVEKLHADDLESQRNKLSKRLQVLRQKERLRASGVPDLDPPYPLEHLLVKMDAKALDDLLVAACEKPLIADSDPFTQLLYKQLVNAGETSSIIDKSVAAGVSEGAKNDVEVHEDGDQYPKGPLEKQKLLSYNLPIASEDTEKGGIWDSTMRFLQDELASWLLGDQLPLYDEFNPRFFSSNEEAGVYFWATMQDYMPRVSDMANPYNLALMVEGDISVLVFEGMGQWYLKGVTNGEWPDREASAACTPPEGSAYVLDLSHMAEYKVREAYVTYGACVFFNEQREPLGIWREATKTLVLPPTGDTDVDGTSAWRFALWHFKVSLYIFSFGPSHLVSCHWIVSNTLVTSMREQLEPMHPLRTLTWPFCFRAITINHAAVVKLAKAGGGLERVGAMKGEENQRWIADLTKRWRYESFEERMTSSGMSEEQLATLPMVQDGRKMISYLKETINALLALEYTGGESADDDDAILEAFAPFMEKDGAQPAFATHPVVAEKSVQALGREDLLTYLKAKDRKPVTDDKQACAFWATANTAAMIDHPLNLPPLSRATLCDYLVHAIFHATCVHELIGNILMDVTVPTHTAGRCLPEKFFGPDRVPQASVQDWMRMIATTAATTTLPVPKLLTEMRRLAERHTGKGEWAAARILDAFANNLDIFAKDLERLNDERKHPFGVFHPRRLEVSVSL